MPVGKIAPVVPSTKPPVKQLVQDKTPTPSKAAADDDDDDDEAMRTMTMMTTRNSSSSPRARPPARSPRSRGFVRPILPNYRKMLAIVVFGVWSRRCSTSSCRSA